MDFTRSARNIYQELEQDREPFLERARDAAKLTIPGLLPPDDHDSHSRLPTPFQGLGARGVNNLASKFLLALLPPNQSFFRMSLSEAHAELVRSQNAATQAEIDASLVKIEKAVSSEIERRGHRVKVFEAFKHMIVAGNALLYMDDESRLRVFHLDNYVVRRDPMDTVLVLVTKECIAEAALTPAQQELVKSSTVPHRSDKVHDLFTLVYLEDGKYHVRQELSDVIIPESQGTFSKDELPYLPLRLEAVADEDYGRGRVEEFMGDLISLEGLTQAIVEGSAAAAKILFMVAPNGTTRIKDMAKAPNGGFISGNGTDVTVLQSQKQADLSIASQTANSIEQRLGFAFLLNTSIQRQAERVTAEEVRFMAQELETALGGVYSVLAQEFQLPLVRILMRKMVAVGKLPKIDKKVLEPVIITGIEALGRGNDLTRLDIFIQGAAQAAGPQVLAQYINWSDYFTRRAAALGIDAADLVKTQDQIQAEMQQAQAAQMAQALGPKALEMGGQALTAPQSQE
jgi:hypothetical protein